MNRESDPWRGPQHDNINRNTSTTTWTTTTMAPHWLLATGAIFSIFDYLLYGQLIFSKILLVSNNNYNDDGNYDDSGYRWHSQVLGLSSCRAKDRLKPRAPSAAHSLRAKKKNIWSGETTSAHSAIDKSSADNLRWVTRFFSLFFFKIFSVLINNHYDNENHNDFHVPPPPHPPWHIQHNTPTAICPWPTSPLSGNLKGYPLLRVFYIFFFLYWSFSMEVLATAVLTSSHSVANHPAT